MRADVLVNQLFDEWAASYARGERPDPLAYLQRAGAHVADLSRLMDGFLRAWPRAEPDRETIELARAWMRGEPPLLALRTKQGLRRDTVVDRLVAALGLDPAKRAKVKRYYHELESGLLEPRGVDLRVWEVLAETLKAQVADLVAWRPRSAEAAGVYLRADSLSTVPPAQVTREEPEDEIDRLFRTYE